MRLKTTLLMMMLAALLPAATWAYDFRTDGICYNILSDAERIVEVTNGESYAGDIVLPSQVEHGGTTYSVVQIGTDAFAGCHNLLSIVIPEGVTVIMKTAFEECHYLKRVTLPSTLKRIGTYSPQVGEIGGSFGGCWSLDSIDIPEGVEYIALGSFKNCINLRSVHLPESLTYIGQHAFEGCERLQSITLPPSINYLDFMTFSGCTGLTYVAIKTNQVFSIADNTFSESTYQNAILYVNKGMTEAFAATAGWKNFGTISDDEPDTTLVSFFDADGLCFHVTSVRNREVEVHKGDMNMPYKGDIVIPTLVTNAGITYAVTSIAAGAFRGDSPGNGAYSIGYNHELKSVYIPDGLTNIGNEVFACCDSMVSVRLPEDITHIPEQAFFECCSLRDITLPSSVTTIGNIAFMYCYSIQSIDIPEGVTTIPSGAFQQCTSLAEVHLPQSLTTIEGGAFSGCHSFRYLTIPSSITSIQGSAFAGSGLQTVIIEEGVTSLGSEVFSGCTELKSVSLPSTLKELERGLFKNCYSLESAEIPEGVAVIADEVFRGCVGLKKLHIPASVGSIGYEVFSNCATSLTDITVAEGNPCFDSREGCNAIIETSTNKLLLGCRNTVIPANVDTIGRYAFRYCEGLIEVTVPEGVRMIDSYAFEGCPQLQTLSLPSSVRELGFQTFNECQRLERVDLPEGVEVVGYSSFRHCDNLQAITIPASIQQIGWNTFYECNNLKSVTLRGEEPIAINPNVFSDITYQQAEFTVPEGSEEKYAHAEGWGNFYINDDPQGISDLMAQDTSVEVSAQGGKVSIRQAQAFEPITIYGIDGRRLTTLRADHNGCAGATLPTGHIYIIKTKTATKKIHNS